MTMTSIDQQEQRFASFILDCESAIEFAIHADAVIEATPVIGRLQPLPASVPYLEGLMHLRDDAIPVINMKKRLGLPSTDYGTDAKVAVVHVGQLRLGLLFDDIKEVLVVGTDAIEAVHPVFQDGEGIISDLIKLDDGRRTMELLDLKRLLGHGEPLETFSQAKPVPDAVAKTYSRFVIFTSLGQDYGVPVEQVQEITFLSKIDDVFKNDAIEGVVALRGHPVPVLSATRLLQTQSRDHTADEDTRVLILNAETFQYGVIADSVREIISIPDDAIMALPRSGHATVNGIYQRFHGANIMLLQVDTLIEVQAQELQSVARLKTDQEEEQWTVGKAASRHLITADCYLIFSIGRNFAIKLNDVQEIIEPRDLLTLPSATGFDRRVLNLRGVVVPVINLHAFYGYGEEDTVTDKKLVIARSQDTILALEVDHIRTIYKQVQYKPTPSLNPQLQNRKDTLDRLIEYVNESGVKEHVLVLNIRAMMANHLGMIPSNQSTEKILDIKENDHGNQQTG